MAACASSAHIAGTGLTKISRRRAGGIGRNSLRMPCGIRLKSNSLGCAREKIEQD